jgi:hypothetical protein
MKSNSRKLPRRNPLNAMFQTALISTKLPDLPRAAASSGSDAAAANPSSNERILQQEQEQAKELRETVVIAERTARRPP